MGSQSVVGVAEQVDFDGEGVAVADGGAVEMFVLRFPPPARWKPRSRGAAFRGRLAATGARSIGREDDDGFGKPPPA